MDNPVIYLIIFMFVITCIPLIITNQNKGSRRNLGEILINDKQSYKPYILRCILIVLWPVSIIAWFTLTLGSRFFAVVDIYSILMFCPTFISYIFFIVTCLATSKPNQKIYTNAILIQSDVIYWSEIESYKYINYDLLKFEVAYKILFINSTRTINWKISNDSRKELVEALNKYLPDKKVQSFSC